MTPHTDYGADLVADYNGQRTVVQAKRYGHPVGLKAVQEVAGARAHYRAHRAMVVTNASFTPQAVNLAQSTGVELWDRGRLAYELARVRASGDGPSVSTSATGGWRPPTGIGTAYRRSRRRERLALFGKSRERGRRWVTLRAGRPPPYSVHMQSSPKDVSTTSAPLGHLEPLGAVLPRVEAMQEQVRGWQRRQAKGGREEDTALAESAQVVLKLEGAGEETLVAETPRPIPALLEYELARRGLFALEPNRRLEGLKDTEDMVGVFTVETPVGLGQLSVFELELMIWIMGRWDERGDDKVRFTLRECARDFGTSWGGSRAEFLANALDRLHGTRFKAVRFRQRVRRRSRRWEHLLDEVEWEERADSLEGPSRGHVVVTVTLGRALSQRLRAKEAKRIDWATLHRKIQSELGKRLYAFLEAQKGFPIEDESDGQALVIYEVTITEALLATLGCRDSHARRLRGKLAKAGEEITSADESYKHVGVRRGKGRGVHLLRMLRAAS